MHCWIWTEHRFVRHAVLKDIKMAANGAVEADTFLCFQQSDSAKLPQDIQKNACEKTDIDGSKLIVPWPWSRAYGSQMSKSFCVATDFETPMTRLNESFRHQTHQATVSQASLESLLSFRLLWPKSTLVWWIQFLGLCFHAANQHDRVPFGSLWHSFWSIGENKHINFQFYYVLL